ncbi:alpha/beta hydrolase [Chitinibacteraceae bacterium HSL-7]
MNIELIHRAPAGPARHAPPILMIHGAYTGAWCWESSFLPYLSGHGFDCYAMSLSGHAGSPQRSRLDHYSLSDFEADIVQVTSALPAKPILLGHSLGGHVAQRVARHHPVAGLALLASVPPYGLLGSLPYMMTTAPHLLLQMNRYQWLHDAEALDVSVLRQLLFSDETSSEHILQFAARVQPESGRALAELLLPQPWTVFGMPADIPSLVIGVEHDRVIATTDVWATARAWHTQPVWVSGVGHAMMCDAAWLNAAEPVLRWLNESWAGQA